MFKILLLVTTIFILAPSIVTAEEIPNDDGINPVIDIMVISKATGMCGVFQQMYTFQEATKMAGGDEFILRFLQTEAARLNRTPESFMATCSVVTEQYNTTMKILGSDL